MFLIMIIIKNLALKCSINSANNNKKIHPFRSVIFFGVNILLKYQSVDDCLKVRFLCGKVVQFVC